MNICQEDIAPHFFKTFEINFDKPCKTHNLIYIMIYHYSAFFYVPEFPKIVILNY